MNPFRYGCAVGGDHFCPRPKLERELRAFASAGQNLVIQGDRRMGKTSLVKEVISRMRGERLVYIDLYCIHTLSDFCRRALSGVSAASDKLPFLKRAMGFVNRLRPTLAFDSMSGAPVISIDARAAEEPDSLGAVMRMLERLGAEGKTCIVFDEFQDILDLPAADTILAEMRSTVQFQPDTPYFFMGSSRNDMMRIFDDSESPFFKSALTFSVGEIDRDDFKVFLRHRFSVGGRKITETALDAVLSFADSVSGDVQELCEALWETTEDGSEINEGDIPRALELIFSREGQGYESQIKRITPLQFKVLRGLAELSPKRIYSEEFMSHVQLTSTGSIRKALARLVSERVIGSRGEDYRFANPFFREWLRRKL